MSGEQQWTQSRDWLWENFWVPDRDATARKLLRLAQEFDRTLARRLGAAAPGNEFACIVAELADSLKHKYRNVRRAAARLLEKAFAPLRTPPLSLGRSMPAELRPVLPALLTALADEDYAVRLSVLGALEEAVRRCAPDPVLAAVTEHTLGDPRPRIAVRSVRVIMALELDAASAAVPALAGLLQHADKRVQCLACRELARFGPEARCAVPALVEILSRENNRLLREQAARALARIDGRGIIVARLVSDLPSQQALLTLLRAIGPRVRRLRRGLQLRWEGGSTTVRSDSEPAVATEVRPETSAAAVPKRPAHSSDFRSVNWFGSQYSFTPNQAKCVKLLWENWKQGTPEVGGQTLLVETESNAGSLRLVFRGHRAWGTMIIQGGTKGSFRLNPPHAG